MRSETNHNGVDVEKIKNELQSFFDIPTNNFADKSIRWLFQEKEVLQGLVEIVANEYAAFMDFDRAKDRKRTHISDTLRGLESDIIFSVPYHSGIIYFL